MASSDDPSLLKRKRSSQAHAADGPAWKRPAIEAYPLDDKAREQLRSGVSSLFNHYQSLHNAEADGADVVNFQALLDAAQGDCVSRRLAARLIPRFIAKLPRQADTAAAILIDLHEYKQPALHAVTVLVNQTRRDALQGLGSIIAAVPADAAGNGHLPGSSPVVPPALARVLDYLLRLLLECRDGDDEPAEEGELDNGAMVASLLRKAFRTHSQAVLIFLSKALQSSDPELQQGTRAFISRHLLSERLLQQHKHKHGTSSSSNMDEDGDLGPSTSGPEGPAKCLAAEVLLASEALQSWLQESIRAARKDPKAAGSREAIGLMERLLQLLPPPVPPDPTPAQQQQQQQQQQALERQGSREHRHHHQHHHHQQQQQQQQQQLHERRASGGLASTANGVGGAAQQQGSAVNGGVHAATQRLASLSTAELAAQRDDHWRERRDLFPPPGGSVCRAEPCLWLGCLPQNATRSMLLAALSRYSAPKELHLLDGPGQDEACAVFASVKEAAFCFEATAGTQLLGPSPLRVEFCGTMPSHSPLARAPTYRPSSHIWLSAGGVAWSPHDIASVIVGAGLLQPLQIFTVGGAAPGYLVQLPHASHVDAAVAALQRRARELGAGHPGYHQWQGRQQQQQSPGGGGYAGPGRAAPMPHPPQQQPLQRHPSSGYAGPMPMDLDPPGPGNTPGGAAVLPSPAGPGGSNAPGSSGSCSLWLGNLANEVPDEEYLKAFGRFGKLLGHKFLRSSACAFVDFASPAAAARAKEELHSKWFGKCQLRIDFARGARPGGNGPFPGSGNTPLPNGAASAGAGAAGPGTSGRPHFGRSSSGPGPPQQPGAHTPQHQQQWRQHEQQQQQGPGSQEPAPTPFGSSGQRLARTHSGRREASPPLPFALNGPSTGPAAAAAAAAGPAGGPSGAHMPHAAAAHGATPPLPPVAPPPLPAVPPPGGAPAWSGMLCKSGSQYCTAQCRDDPSLGTPPPPAALGPSMWPPRLDVTLRVPIPQMLDFYKAAAAHGRAVRWLEPGPMAGDAVGLHKFARYLSERERAGVVKMPADGSLPPRTMYIVSPEQGVCAQLGVHLVPGGVLLAVVIFARPA